MKRRPVQREQRADSGVRQRQLAAIAVRIPTLRIGDHWTGIAGQVERVEILRFEPFDELTPWPKVFLADPDGNESHVGAPAFMFGRLIKRGTGGAWRPPQP